MCQTLTARVSEHLAALRDALRDQDAPRLREAAHKCCGMPSEFSAAAAPRNPRRKESGREMRLLLAVHNAYTDPTSGAARSMRTLLEWLHEAGHDCRVLATARFDAAVALTIEQHLEDLGVPVEDVA